MNIKHKELLEALETLAFESIICENNDIVDLKITGYSFNTFDDLIYPEFLVIVKPEYLSNNYRRDYIKTCICSTLDKYNSTFFNDCFRLIPANVKTKINPQV